MRMYSSTHVDVRYCAAANHTVAMFGLKRSILNVCSKAWSGQLQMARGIATTAPAMGSGDRRTFTGKVR